MRRRLATIIVLSVSPLIWLRPTGVAQEKQQSAKQKKAPAKADVASSTGCVDQQNGLYVLIHDQTLALIANLEADGFPTEGFAKHVGQKVTVRGTSTGGGTERPVFKVRSVETVSDTCGPKQ
jgi:competence protein ComGC